jgi:hypothetical protein
VPPSSAWKSRTAWARFDDLCVAAPRRRMAERLDEAWRPLARPPVVKAVGEGADALVSRQCLLALGEGAAALEESAMET